MKNPVDTVLSLARSYERELTCPTCGARYLRSLPHLAAGVRRSTTAGSPSPEASTDLEASTGPEASNAPDPAS